MPKPQYTAAEGETLLEDSLRRPSVRDAYSNQDTLDCFMTSLMSSDAKQTILFNYPQINWYLNN